MKHRKESERNSSNEIGFFSVFCLGLTFKRASKKMWQKCGILCLGRSFWQESGRMAKKTGTGSLELKKEESWQKNGVDDGT